MNMIESRGILVQEAKELLEGMELALLDIEEHGSSPDRINEIFRAAHTIKGSSGIFGYELIVSFTHVMENLLVKVRNQEIAITSSMTSLLLSCGDYLEALVDQLDISGNLVDPDPTLREKLVQGLNQFVQVQQTTQAHQESVNKTENSYRLRLIPTPHLLQDGLDPVPFISYLGSSGEIQSVSCLASSLPDLYKLDTELCYLKFEITFKSQLTETQIQDSFQFFSESCILEIDLLNKPVNTGTLEEQGFEIFQPLAMAEQDIGNATSATNNSNNVKREASIIKVDARKLDQLINSVGELVIRSASGRSIERSNGNSYLHEFLEEVDHYIEQIRERALNLRMAPVGDIFQRFPRLIRDLSKELGKKIELKISGAETEIDKLMLDKLGDPLTHIIRNAMDHGIEKPDARRAQGKPEQGTIELNAFHESGWVVIDIIDDGRGLNKQKILQKAIERNLIDSNENLTDKEIYKLIFEPGFSTAEKITDISGRGVGMDVVMSNINDLRGSVEIDSIENEGSRFRLRLPLTLSIIDGFHVSVDHSQFVIPLEHVVECIDMPETEESRQIVNLRGEPLPFVRLKDEFRIDDNHANLAQKNAVRECLVVLDVGGNRAGIVVDKLVGELQAVIKPLNRWLRGVKGVGGSTILGDGHVALILDVPALMNKAKK